MKWITLKMHMIPIIFQEIDSVTETYINLLTSIRNEETERQGSNSNRDQRKEFYQLREEITSRINELEQFYEDNFEDTRVTNIEKARIRLKKLLMYDLDTLNKIENIANQEKLFKVNPVQSKPIVEDNKKKNNPNNNNTNANPKNELMNKILNSNNTNNNETENKKNKNTNNAILKSIKNKEKPGDIPRYMKPISRAKKGAENNENNKFIGLQSSNTENFDLGDISKCKEIIFKIKLTESEYKKLMKEKGKIK